MNSKVDIHSGEFYELRVRLDQSFDKKTHWLNLVLSDECHHQATFTIFRSSRSEVIQALQRLINEAISALPLEEESCQEESSDESAT